MKVNFKEHEKSLNQTKNLKGKFCSRPFRLLEIHKEFYAFPCCPAWLPVIVGNCDQTSIMKVWNNENMQKIRQSIHDGSFQYCDYLECPEIQADRLPSKNDFPQFADKVFLEGPPSELALCYDETCNLACPSCRTNRISYSQGPEFEKRLKFTEQVIDLIERYCHEYPILLRITGSGDPIASPIFYKLLKSLDSEKQPKLRICLQTNGVMLTEKIWESLHKIHNSIDSISISIDAAQEETYFKVRPFGSWSQLQKNLLYLSDLRSKRIIKQFLSLNFVVQKENFREIPEFIRMARRIGNIDQVFFSFVNDWGTWSKEDYNRQCVWKKDHPDFEYFLGVLRDPELDHPIVHLGNLTTYRQFAFETST